MPSKIQVATNLETKYLNNAPKKNREKIRNVLQIFRDSNNVTRNTAEKVVMSLYLPSACGRVGKKGKPGKADREAPWHHHERQCAAIRKHRVDPYQISRSGRGTGDPF